MLQFAVLIFACIVVSNQLIFDAGENDYFQETTGDLSFERFLYHQRLNDDYDLYWNYNSSHIVFKTVVRTKGFIGFGISPNGGMINADVVIGWVKDGQAHFTDRYAEGHYMPAIDSSQDWTLIEAEEEGEVTTLVFLRKLITCDPSDLPITNGTTRVIYSYNPIDPTSDTEVPYHGYTRRGTKSILLLSPPPSTEEVAALPADVSIIDLLNNKFKVPTENTLYACVMLKIPDLGQKHHVIRYEPVIQKGHENLVHHILLWACEPSFKTDFLGVPFSCYTELTPEILNCSERALMVWTIGGQTFNFPNNVGQSLGTPGDPVYFRMEIHYNNPLLRADFVDNSGLRLYLTKELRKFDAGLIMTGLWVDKYHVIPPYEEKFVTPGYCTPDCIEKSLGGQEVRIFASLPHSHLLGRKIKTRHIRKSVELSPISEDHHYDFNYQEWRLLREERVLKQGDFLLVECEYDSSERTSVTYGGLNTTMEMCQSFHYYYPKTDLSVCLSSFKYRFDKTSNVEDFLRDIEGRNWSDPVVRLHFKRDVEESQLLSICGDPTKHLTTEPITKPTISQIYQNTDTCLH